MEEPSTERSCLQPPHMLVVCLATPLVPPGFYTQPTNPCKWYVTYSSPQSLKRMTRVGGSTPLPVGLIPIVYIAYTCMTKGAAPSPHNTHLLQYQRKSCQ